MKESDKKNTPQRREKWRKIVAISQQMLTLATEYDWEAVIPLEKERKKLLMAYFETFNKEENSKVVSSDIQELIQMNEKLIETAKRSQQGVRDKFQAIKQGIKAKDAYES